MGKSFRPLEEPPKVSQSEGRTPGESLLAEVGRGETEGGQRGAAPPPWPHVPH